MSAPENAQQQAYAQGYQVGYQHGLQASQQQAQGGGSGPFGPTDYPVNVIARYPDRSSRLLMFFLIFKPLILIPHLFVMWLLGLASGFVMVIAWFAVVFTGNYPKGLWEFMLGVYRWQSRISAYMLGLTDQYPPFSLN
jgi:hypothetical protein